VTTLRGLRVFGLQVGVVLAGEVKLALCRSAPPSTVPEKPPFEEKDADTSGSGPRTTHRAGGCTGPGHPAPGLPPPAQLALELPDAIVGLLCPIGANL
jgi:hypothetical protein